MQPLLLTYRDAIDHSTDWVSGVSSAASQRDIRRAIQSALREVSEAHDWIYYATPGRVQIRAPYSTGSVEYQHDARTLILTGGIWPAWAEDAYVRVADTVCAVEARLSNAMCLLDYDMNPKEDVAAGATFSLYPAWYALPEEFSSMSGPWYTDYWGELQYVTPTQWMALDRYNASSGTPRYYTIMGVPDLMGSFGLFIHPASDTDATLDFVYRRKARQMRYSGYAATDVAGTVTFTKGSASVSGSGTSFAERMVGAVIRFGSDGTNLPGGLDSLYPFVDERTISYVDSSTLLTLDSAAFSTGSARKYVISDVVDVDPAATNAFLRCCEKQLAFMRNMKSKNEFVAAYEEALFSAKSSQRRTTQRVVVSTTQRARRRLADYPTGVDVP